MALGNAELIKGLAKVKSNIDSGMFQAVQLASVEALGRAEKVKEDMNRIYRQRRDTLVGGLKRIGWEISFPKATFYVWAPVFGDHDSFSLAKALLDKADIVVTPGAGFGPSGEGYIRMALTKDVDILNKAVERIKENFFC